ncbi:MAG: hypothetical protein ACLP5V_13765 [Candidatus Bathyarchaeia archaeon]
MGKKRLADFFTQFLATAAGVILALYYDRMIPSSAPAWTIAVVLLLIIAVGCWFLKRMKDD